MRVLLVIAGALVAGLAIAGSPMRVDGVPIYGRVKTVSVSDIHEAIKDAKQSLNGNPSRLVIIDGHEIHVYLNPKYLGWVPFGRTVFVEPNGAKRPGWSIEGFGFGTNPKLLRLIKNAEKVYIFSIVTPLKPSLGHKHHRLLSKKARQSLSKVLGYKNNWYEGMYLIPTSVALSKSVGISFVQDKNKLMLLFVTPCLVEGTFNGENVQGVLKEKICQKMGEWMQLYARREHSRKE